jgi:hypothetical protein
VAPENGAAFSFALVVPQGAHFLYASFPFQLIPGEVAMRDVYQVIYEKELEIVQVRQEIDALRSILPLLTDDEEDDDVPVDGPAYPSLRVVNRE